MPATLYNEGKINVQENSKNLEVMNIEQILRDIAAKSSLTYADVAAGDAGGLKLRMKYTAHGSGVMADSGLPLLADELPDRRYLIASITTPIVAMSAVQLAAEGHFAMSFLSCLRSPSIVSG